MELVDTHCHLTFDPLFGNLNNVLSRALGKNVTLVVVPSYDIESWHKVEKVGKHDGVVIALGLHPWVADQKFDLDELESRLRRSNAVALGEIGLDFKIDSPGKSQQIATLKNQLEIAHRMDLPVLLHCRGAFEELIELLREFTPPIRGVIHAFSKGPQLLERFLNLGLYIAFGGAVTRSKAKQARRSAILVPSDRMLLETDAPSIGLDGIDPIDVEPQHVADIANTIAKLRNVTIEEIALNTTANAKRLFRPG